MEGKLSYTLDSYEKQSVIGKGSFGLAYLVKSKANQRLYVIKSIAFPSNSSSSRDEKAQSRLLDEIKILQTCKHINVIKFKHCFISNASFDNPKSELFVNIVMEYADAGDLEKHIKQHRSLQSHFPEKQVRNWLVQLLMALQYLHTSVRVMHRDIKSQNIFMTSNKLLKLGDFGVSKILRYTLIFLVALLPADFVYYLCQLAKALPDVLTQNSISSPGIDYASTSIGTPTNLCPEIVNGDKYDFRSDIWSLGCVVYEMCSLKPAFEARNFEEIMSKIKCANYAPIPQKYSTTLSDLIRVMLKVDPSRRPTALQLATCQALKDDLELQLSYIKNLPVSSRSSDASSDSAGATRNSCRSIGSGSGEVSSGFYSAE